MKRRRPTTTAAGPKRRRRQPKPSRDAPTVAGRRRIATTPASRALPAGTPPRLGPYRILETLGEGGMGTVYLAEEIEIPGRRVAVKWIRAALAGPEILRRFDAERRALARMDHPSIARVFAAGSDDDGRPYIVMEYVAGEWITEYCSRTEPSEAVLLGLLCDLGRGLLHAHRQGIVHRDVKPSNVLIAEGPDGGPVPKIIDFGIAKLLDATAQLTRPGDVLGTPDYMSPEQLRGEPVDRRTDVYAFGVLIREIVTGEPGIPAEPVDWPAGLEHVVERCVAVDPARRFADFSLVTAELEALREPWAGRTIMGTVSAEHQQSLEAIFAAGAGEVAEGLLGILEEAASRSPESLLSTLEEAGRLRRTFRTASRTRRLLEEAAAAHRRGAAVCRGVLGGEAGREAWVRAAALCREAHEIESGSLEAPDWTRWGDALLQIGEDRPFEAADAYREALALDERHVAALYGLALARLWQGGPPEDWLGAAWRVLALEPESAAGHNHLGVVLYESRRHPGVSLYGQDKLTESVAAFEKALELGGGGVMAFNLALALLARGEKERAERALDRARQLGWNCDAEDCDAEEVAAGTARPVEILPYQAARA